MSGRRQGGIGPTSSLMKVNKGGSVGFTSPDPADGARPTTAPSYYQRHERWKQNLSEEDFKSLVRCVLLQHYKGARSYRIKQDLVIKLKCPETFQKSDLNWLKQWSGYNFFAKQVHSQYLASLINNKM